MKLQHEKQSITEYCPVCSKPQVMRLVSSTDNGSLVTNVYRCNVCGKKLRIMYKV